MWVSVHFVSDTFLLWNVPLTHIGHDTDTHTWKNHDASTCAVLHTHTHCCRVRLSVDWMSMEVTRHQTDLPTQYTVESAATRANNTCVYAELQQTSAFAHALLRLHIQVNRVWKCIYKTKYRGGLDASRQQEPNKLHEKCMSKVWAHTPSQFAVLPLTHTHTNKSEHEWRRQSVHTGSSWSWMCQSQQLNASLNVKVSN